MSSTIVAAFEAALAIQGTSLTHKDLLRAFPACERPTDGESSSMAVPSRKKIKYFKDFDMAPDDANRKLDKLHQKTIKTHGSAYLNEILGFRTHQELKKKRAFDFRLNDQETKRLKQNGFVVSERLAADSFAEQYYRLYSDDMPVYVTSDSVLHAWHRSFDAFLVDLEEQQLIPLLMCILEKARCVCLGQSTVGNETFAAALCDVDTYLAVAQSLVSGEFAQTTVGNADVVAELVMAVKLQELSSAELSSCATRDIDFSLFKPRGHYTKSERLSCFFRAMTWLGTIDFRVDGTEDPVSDQLQLQRACVLIHVLREAQVLVSVDAMHSIVSTLTGDGVGADSMTPQQLHELLGNRDIIATYCGPDGETALRELQDEIANQRLGVQAIAGHPLMESDAAAISPSVRSRLPTSFTFFGQQFVWSAFVFSKLVYDQVLHDNVKVVRRIPSAVDAAFALLGNDVASGVIARRLKASAQSSSEDYVRFRDGAPYASNLLAARQVIDEQLSKADPATCSVALLWQLALRELSAKSSNDAGVFQSEAWKKRQMNTQIASFTQLRHDTILYAKQSYSRQTRCEYAAGFVDPYPAFWTKMQELAQRMLKVIGSISEIIPDSQKSNKVTERGLTFFTTFASVSGKLKDIAVAQSLKQELSPDQDNFLKSVIEERFGSGASRYLGWYPSLFYTKREDSGVKDHLVADVHTDTPSIEHGDPGGILHLGVGDVNLGFFVVDKVMYAGPVFSSYEFVTKINDRLNDEKFSERVHALKAPRWARKSFLVGHEGEVQPEKASSPPRKVRRAPRTDETQW